jgi:hypothetical protein
MDDGMFDPKKLKCVAPAAPAIAPASSPKPSRIKRSENFFFKMPDIWSDTLSTIPEASAATYRIAHYLVKYGWRSPDHKVKLTNVAASSVGVSRHGKYAAIDKLRAAGLIAVRGDPRKSPTIFVRYLT